MGISVFMRFHYFLFIFLSHTIALILIDYIIILPTFQWITNLKSMFIFHFWLLTLFFDYWILEFSLWILLAPTLTLLDAWQKLFIVVAFISKHYSSNVKLVWWDYWILNFLFGYWILNIELSLWILLAPTLTLLDT